jgi:hypothetical protein
VTFSLLVLGLSKNGRIDSILPFFIKKYKIEMSLAIIERISRSKATDYVPNNIDDVTYTDNIVLTPATLYFFIDSANRYQNSACTSSTFPTVSNWNSFTLQKPMPLVNVVTNRITVADVNFYWTIPNITSLNSVLTIQGMKADNSVVSANIAVPFGFTTPANIASALSSYPYLTCAIVAPNRISFTFNSAYNDWKAIRFSVNNFHTQPSLAGTIGLLASQVNTWIPVVNGTKITGGISKFQYTPYIDICSDEFTKYASYDNSSSNNNNNGSVICRVYCSVDNDPATYGTAPFMIYRQFKNPKVFFYDRKALVDWFSVTVIDAWGNLIPLDNGDLADFQITCLTSG